MHHIIVIAARKVVEPCKMYYASLYQGNNIFKTMATTARYTSSWLTLFYRGKHGHTIFHHGDDGLSYQVAISAPWCQTRVYYGNFNASIIGVIHKHSTDQ